MPDLSRRVFAASLAGAPLLRPSPGSMPRRKLGRIDFEAGILGIGSEHLGASDATYENAERTIHEALERGVNYIDTAPTYALSEERLGRALKGRRDGVFLVSKVETNARGDVMYQLRDSLHKLQTDYLDCVHIHNVGREDRFPSLYQMLATNGTLGGLLEAKKQGMIRHIGCTAHQKPARVLPVFATGAIELFMCQLNFVERHIYGFENEVLPEARRRGIGIIAMKVLGGPTGRNKGAGAPLANAGDYELALRYAWSVPDLAVAIVGIRNPNELRQAINAAESFRPLSEAERSHLDSRGRTLAAAWGPLRGPVA